LETEGLVLSEWVAEGGAPRREYWLTTKGRAALSEWASLMCERGRLIDDFLEREARLERCEGG
jgi:DNA-binding PadR family transcriptional regulator